MQTGATPPSRIDSGLKLQIHGIIEETLLNASDEHRRPTSVRPIVARPCDGCGESAATVDLWAENSETGEQLWLCLACGD